MSNGDDILAACFPRLLDEVSRMQSAMNEMADDLGRGIGALRKSVAQSPLRRLELALVLIQSLPETCEEYDARTLGRVLWRVRFLLEHARKNEGTKPDPSFLPKAMTEAPPVGATFFVPQPIFQDSCNEFTWSSKESLMGWQLAMLAKGCCFATREEANAVVDTMLALVKP